MADTKAGSLARLMRRTRSALSARDWSRAPIKVFTYPRERAVAAFEMRAVLERPSLYPEDYANYTLFEALFGHAIATREPDEADYIFVPLFLPAYELARVPLHRAIERLDLIGSGKKHLLFSSWDTYPRPALARANPFCAVSRVVARTDRARRAYAHDRSWLDERFILLTFESSIDVWPDDLAVFPTRPDRARSPLARGRDLALSFVGTVDYDALPRDHVRGGRYRAAWRRLAERSGPRSFVGSLSAARARYGETANQASLSARSVFTLCPAGYARWSFRLTEAALAGSIPVILSDYYVKPLFRHIPWDDFAVTLPESALPRVDTILARIEPRVVRRLQENLARYQAYFRPAGLADLVVQELAARRSAAPR